MTRRITAYEIAQHLTRAGHTNALTGPVWRPGHRAQQASPRTVRVWHDGPDETQHLDQYAARLRLKGYTVIPERGTTRRRPALRVTQF
jgi:hypothetical protein